MKRKILFSQPNYAVSATQYYLPYTVGILWSYSYQFPEIRDNYECIDLLFRRAPIDDYIAGIDELDVAVFSCYLWNWEYNKALAKAIKAKFPQCLILFGGPQVPDTPSKHLPFLSSNKYIDVIVNGEGEHALYDILINRLKGIKPARVIQTERIKDLDTIPSPYLTGIFDPLIERNPEIEWSMVWETNRGCPFQCTFCDWGGVTYSKIKKFDIDRVVDEFAWACDHNVGFIFMGDANFGVFYERDKEIATRVAELRKTAPRHIVINANWAKNQTAKTLEIAKIISARSLTVSFQSTDETVLKMIKRDNMAINNIKQVIQCCREQNVPIYSELILGLPGETFESWKAGLYTLLELGLHNALEAYFSVLLENAELNNSQQHAEHEYDIIKADYSFGFMHAKDPLPEYQNLIRGTNYMPFDKLVDSYMLVWLLNCFHYSGLTQVYARYLNKSNNISFEEFYTKLNDYILQTPYFKEHYDYAKNKVINFLTTGKADEDNLISKTPGWYASVRLFSNMETTNYYLRKFITKEYDIPNDVMLFQNVYCVRDKVEYPITLPLSSNVYEYVFDDKVDEYKEEKKEYKLISNIDKSIEYMKALHFGRRSGYNKVSIEVLS